MKIENSHLSEQQLLLHIDGELAARDEKTVRSHLEECWKCRVRRQELERAIAGFVRFQEREFAGKLPPDAGPRALLKAKLAQLSGGGPSSRPEIGWAFAAAACAAVTASLVLTFFVLEHDGRSKPQALILLRNSRKTAAVSSAPREEPASSFTVSRHTSAPFALSIPDSALTPGVALLENRQAVCSQPNTKNKIVPVALQRKVFEEYRIKAAEPRAYEVDYLITPALGGADDIHNLWPHSYSATAWNARVKDDLEDRLRQMVCDGSLDLPTAQREIAENWIAAYKKYFQTDRPLHR